MQRPSRPVVLVEGASDAAALRALARTWDLAEDLEIVVLGGATNVAREARRLRAAYGAPVLIGLCDARERRHLERVDPPLDTVLVCDRDLEDELFRAAGLPAVVAAIEELGDAVAWQTFRGQPEWRGRPISDQLRRFAGTRSRRKQLLAERVARRLTRETTPAVLAALLEAVATRVPDPQA
ncbi:hypothetical protein [Nocardioides coralli]|uniref:hypothetical protein n=1 Tax=Nocardioides coralli TaxID=2872154 RepID=UPI001CA4117A|nr:hypothetical protein [Nocardioides coralli]QZY29393.1 hypothetical protein K6T13_01390 [Nocardioides coralli]